MLSQYVDDAYALALLKNGTAGLAYLCKDRVDDTEELVRALREVHAGRSVIDAEVVDKLVSHRTRLAHSPLQTLTPRERDVLAQMGQGRTNAGIADGLSLSPSAVEKHVGAILAKLGLREEPLVHRRVAAVLTYLREVGLDQ